jgi:hypothetical protein
LAHIFVQEAKKWETAGLAELAKPAYQAALSEALIEAYEPTTSERDVVRQKSYALLKDKDLTSAKLLIWGKISKI